MKQICMYMKHFETKGKVSKKEKKLKIKKYLSKFLILLFIA
jgi:hypothetical protein